jgi:hypothetical protein
VVAVVVVAVVVGEAAPVWMDSCRSELASSVSALSLLPAVFFGDFIVFAGEAAADRP